MSQPFGPFLNFAMGGFGTLSFSLKQQNKPHWPLRFPQNYIHADSGYARETGNKPIQAEIENAKIINIRDAV